MIYLLDTNAAIALMKRHPKVMDQVRWVGRSQIRLCAPVEAELWYGVSKSIKQAENRQQLLTLLSWLTSLPFAGDATQHFGEIRAFLVKRGTPIGPYDLQIAAIARANGLTVVTNNTSEFTRVPGLMVEDWLE